jgi:D-serine deaminase-like pyridoxal phosphate-dependent protein
MSTLFPELDTPSLLIEKSILDRNISEMQSICNENDVSLRPHVKSHKSPYLAVMQVSNGAIGISCAKVSEAMVFANAGIRNIQIANIIIGEKKFSALYEIQTKTNTLSVCVDSIDNAKPLAEYFLAKHSVMNVIIMIDCGYARCGISDFGKISELIGFIRSSHSLNFLGITTHAGHAYSAKNNEERISIAEHEGRFMTDLANKIRKEGTFINEVIIGSNPTARHCCRINGVTQIRTGNYIFNDMIQVGLGTVGIEDCALSVLSQVISIPTDDRVIIDAGSKTFSSDRGAHGNENLIGYGKILNKKAMIERLSEEHGIISNQGDKFYIGERLRIIPNHACTTTNMFDKAYLVDADNIINEIEISARGKIQ